MDPMFTAVLPLPVPEILQFIKHLAIRENFQQLSQTFPRTFFQNSRRITLTLPLFVVFELRMCHVVGAPPSRKEKKNAKKARKSLQPKSKEIPKTQGLEGQRGSDHPKGAFRVVLSEPLRCSFSQENSN